MSTSADHLSTTGEQRALFDLLVRGGHVVGPVTGHLGHFDVAIADGAAQLRRPWATLLTSP